jgi:2-amino-4-hydroxy-6-hydroxymethyldihydropteridine diphosphokinase
MLPHASRDARASKGSAGEPASLALHPLVAAAARGELPSWAVAGASRREHMARVARLLDDWATALGSSDDDRARWRAAGYLHDALRDERADVLRPLVPTEQRDLLGPMLHGPAAAERLRQEGVRDEEILSAVAAHTTGGAGLAVLGLALYAADYLEPGRDFGSEAGELHASLRARMPGDLRAVVRDVAAERMRRGLESRRPIHPDTLALYNELAR